MVLGNLYNFNLTYKIKKIYILILIPYGTVHICVRFNIKTFC